MLNRIFWRNAGMLIVMLGLCGCGASLGAGSGMEPDTSLALDGGFEFSASLDKGEVLGLDVPEPDQAAYAIVGAAFDPSMFRLDHFLEHEADGRRRVTYLFTTLQDGTSDILIKMRAGKDGPIQLYKRIAVNVGGDHGLF